MRTRTVRRLNGLVNLVPLRMNCWQNLRAIHLRSGRNLTIRTSCLEFSVLAREKKTWPGNNFLCPEFSKIVQTVACFSNYKLRFCDFFYHKM